MCGSPGIRRRHGATGRSTASFEEAITAFADPLGLVVDDLVHPERALLIGTSSRERIVLTVFVEKSEDETRIISARLATRPERRRYEESE